MRNFKMALIGAGGRGEGLYRVAFKGRKYTQFIAVCDVDTEKCEYIAKEIVEDGGIRPSIYHDYKACIEESQPDAIVIATGWQTHLEIAMFAMERGVAVACEVAGAYTLESLWKLIDCYERTKTPIMMMENCCYGRMELLALNMKRQGLLGTIVHCEGGYHHDLRQEMATRPQHYRIYEYMSRNCDNYPTHEIGPIAKLLDINCGNRFVSLVSVGSGTYGLKEYVEEKNLEWLKGKSFAQSDIVTTVLKCANGETVTITLDTTLPQYYSRGFLVQGTKGRICEENRSVYLDGILENEWEDWAAHFNNVQEYYKKYDHPIWVGYNPGEAGHGGIDWLVFDAFFEALDSGAPMPIDVYDMATWMAISVLTEESLATGHSVAFPDFTKGKWVTNKNNFAL